MQFTKASKLLRIISCLNKINYGTSYDIFISTTRRDYDNLQDDFIQVYISCFKAATNMLSQ